MSNLRKDIEDFVKEFLVNDPSYINQITDLRFLSTLIYIYPEYLDELSDEKVIALNKFTDPMGNNIKGDGESQLAFSYINFKNELYQRVHLFGTAGYMYQCKEEYGLKDTDMYIDPTKDLDEELKIRKEHITDFLNWVFKYDPNRHIRDCYTAYKDKEMTSKKRLGILPENVIEELEKMKTKVRTYNKADELVCEFIKKTTPYEESIEKYGKAPEELTVEETQLNLSEEMQSFIDFYRRPNNPDSIKEIVNGLPSIDLFVNYDRYVSMYWNELYCLTKEIFGLSSKISFGINPYIISKDKNEINEFCETHGKLVQVPINVVNTGAFTLLGPWRQNAENVSFQISDRDEKIIDVNRALDSTKFNEIRNEMVKLKTEKIRKERPLTEEDKLSLKEYGQNMGYSDIVDEAINGKHKTDEVEGLEYEVFVHDVKTGSTKKGMIPFSKKI